MEKTQAIELWIRNIEYESSKSKTSTTTLRSQPCTFLEFCNGNDNNNNNGKILRVDLVNNKSKVPSFPVFALFDIPVRDTKSSSSGSLDAELENATTAKIGSVSVRASVKKRNYHHEKKRRKSITLKARGLLEKLMGVKNYGGEKNKCNFLGNECAFNVNEKARDFKYSTKFVFELNANSSSSKGKEKLNVWMEYRIPFGMEYEKAFPLHKLSSKDYNFYPILMMIMEYLEVKQIIKNCILVSKHFYEVVKKIPLKCFPDDLIHVRVSKFKKRKKRKKIESEYEDIPSILQNLTFRDLKLQVMFCIEQRDDWFIEKLVFFQNKNLKCLYLESFTFDSFNLKQNVFQIDVLIKILEHFHMIEEFSTTNLINIKNSYNRVKDKRFPSIKRIRYKNDYYVNENYEFFKEACPNLEFFQFLNYEFTSFDIKKQNLNQWRTYTIKYDNNVKYDSFRFIDPKNGLGFLIKTFPNIENQNELSFFFYNSTFLILRVVYQVSVPRLFFKKSQIECWIPAFNGHGFYNFYEDQKMFSKNKDLEIILKMKVIKALTRKEYEKEKQNDRIRMNDRIENLPIKTENEIFFETNFMNRTNFEICGIPCYAYLNTMKVSGFNLKPYDKCFFFGFPNLGDNIIRLRYEVVPIVENYEKYKNKNLPISKLRYTDFGEFRKYKNWGRSYLDLNKWWHEEDESEEEKQKKHRFSFKYEIERVWNSVEDYVKFFTPKAEFILDRISESKENCICINKSFLIKRKDLIKRKYFGFEKFIFLGIKWWLEIYPVLGEYKDGKIYPPNYILFEIQHEISGAFSLIGEIECFLKGKKLGKEDISVITNFYYKEKAETIDKDFKIDLKISLIDVKRKEKTIKE